MTNKQKLFRYAWTYTLPAIPLAFLGVTPAYFVLVFFWVPITLLVLGESIGLKINW
jgi:hypothetical protein